MQRPPRRSRWQSRRRRVTEALRTGIPYSGSQSVGFDHYYASGSQHMMTSRKNLFPGSCLFTFDSVAPAQTNETSSRYQGGGVVLWFRTAAALRARESQSHCSL